MKVRLIESFTSHEMLNPKIFDKNQKMHKEVQEALIEIAQNFIEYVQGCEVPIEVFDIWLVGSNAGYNYGDQSDIDVHIIAKYDEASCDTTLLKIVYDFAKSLYNKKHDISVKGYPVEVYVEDKETTSISNGIYSIQKDKWVIRPTPIEEPYDIDITESDLYKKTVDSLKDVESYEDIENFIDNLYIMRKSSLATQGELGEGNLVFKQIRNDGILDELQKRKDKLVDKSLTLERLNK